MTKRLFAIIPILIPMLLVYLLSQVFVRYDIFQLWYGVSPLMHALGGFVTAWTVWMLLRYTKIIKKPSKLPRFVRICVTIGIVLLIGILWEWYEFVLEVMTGANHILGVADTLVDLSMDTVGAIVYSYFFTDIDK